MLVDRAVLDELNRLEESNRNVMALVAWLGFHQTRVLYDQLPRQHGESRWTRAQDGQAGRRLARAVLVDAAARVHLHRRSACAALGMVYATVLVVRSLLGVDTPSGWPTILVVVLVLGGIQLMVIGVMGEYLWRRSRRRGAAALRRPWGDAQPARSAGTGDQE